jgi:hypothetical protein
MCCFVHYNCVVIQTDPAGSTRPIIVRFATVADDEGGGIAKSEVVSVLCAIVAVVVLNVPE